MKAGRFDYARWFPAGNKIPKSGESPRQGWTVRDAISHMAREHRAYSIDTMPLTNFYTEGVCLDLSHKGLAELK